MWRLYFTTWVNLGSNSSPDTRFRSPKQTFDRVHEYTPLSLSHTVLSSFRTFTKWPTWVSSSLFTLHLHQSHSPYNSFFVLGFDSTTLSPPTYLKMEEPNRSWTSRSPTAFSQISYNQEGRLTCLVVIQESPHLFSVWNFLKNSRQVGNDDEPRVSETNGSFVIIGQNKQMWITKGDRHTTIYNLLMGTPSLLSHLFKLNIVKGWRYHTFKGSFRSTSIIT